MQIMMTEKLRNQVIEQAEIHQILSNPSRLLILCSLSQNELSVGEIARQIGATLQNTSQHLRRMKDKGVVESRRKGQTIFYQIARNDVGDNCRRILTFLNN
jgi:ArsR family transcriptional regulator